MLSFRIKQARNALGITQLQLAQMLNLTRTAVVNWETNYSKPTNEILEMLASILKVEKAWLHDPSDDEFEVMEHSIDDNEITFSQKVGLRLKFLRKKNGLTQQKLAKILNSNNTTISKYESGDSEPNFETLLKLADLYKVSIEYFFGRSNKVDSLSFDIVNEMWIMEILSADIKKKIALKKVWEAIQEI
jgi:transcriptional regulator with XRE-family HTH domain